MDYIGKTPAELYELEAARFFDEKQYLQEIVDTWQTRRRALLDLCRYDHPEKTLNAMDHEYREAREKLHSNEFAEREIMLVLLSPLYAKINAEDSE